MRTIEVALCEGKSRTKEKEWERRKNDIFGERESERELGRVEPIGNFLNQICTLCSQILIYLEVKNDFFEIIDFV